MQPACSAPARPTGLPFFTPHSLHGSDAGITASASLSATTSLLSTGSQLSEEGKAGQGARVYSAELFGLQSGGQS